MQTTRTPEHVGLDDSAPARPRDRRAARAATSTGVAPSARMATPLKPFWPCQIALVADRLEVGGRESLRPGVLISCRQATAGRVSSSHSSRRGSRALMPLMLKRWRSASSGGSDAEAGTAAAAGRGVGIFDLERRAAQRFDEIDHAAGDQVEADRIDHQPHAVGFADRDRRPRRCRRGRTCTGSPNSRRPRPTAAGSRACPACAAIAATRWRRRRAKGEAGRPCAGCRRGTASASARAGVSGCWI